MKKSMLSITIFILFLITIVAPYAATALLHIVDAKNPLFTLHYGIFHLPSFLFIVGSALLLQAALIVGTRQLEADHKTLHRQLGEAARILDYRQVDSEAVRTSDNPFIHNILDILRHGGIEEDLELVVEQKTVSLAAKYRQLLNEYSFIATVLPMLGMVGTIAGLLQMFAVGDSVDGFAEKLASLSVALATTLYATLWVVFFTKPQSKEVENRMVEMEHEAHRLLLAAKLFLHTIASEILYETTDTETSQTSDRENTSEKPENGESDSREH